MNFLFGSGDDEALITADVGPGIEWAMRPKAREGRNFELKLMTVHGVVVCSKKLRRGQTFDFRVNVPSQQPALENNAEDSEANLVMVPPSKSDEDKPSGVDADGDDVSICSTTAPPSHTTRFSVASSSASTGANSVAPYAASVASSQPTEPAIPSISEAAVTPPTVGGIAEAPALALTQPPVEISTAICPQCLRQMRSRWTRPNAATYAEGVRCDKCEDIIFEEEDEGTSRKSKVAFFHCKRCWYDLCYSCALRDMREVWWEDD